jgi:hypothetical protein
MMGSWTGTVSTLQYKARRVEKKIHYALNCGFDANEFDIWRFAVQSMTHANGLGL